ncbi:MAG: GAF domain-containing SpoIIE family protein phosphatase [Candidatus Zixiibacteriota bacterium]
MTTQITTDAELKEEVFKLQNKLDKSNIRLRDLATMGTLITSIRDLETILSVVMEMSIRMVDAEVGLILLEDKGKLVSKLAWGIDEAIASSFIYLDNQSITEYCFCKQVPILLKQGKNTFNFGPTVSSIMAMPIKSRSKCYGVVLVINKNSGEHLNEDDQENLELLVNFASVAIDNAILLKELLLKQKYEQELTIAKQIQQAILPSDTVSIDGLDLGTFYRPARYVSGDFYDLFKIDNKNIVIVVGDVSNKGVPAAIVMSATTAIIRSKLIRIPDIPPSQLMFDLNNVLCNGVIKDNDMFATLFIARIDIENMRINYCNAGHNPPFFWSEHEQKIEELPSCGPFVGQFAKVPYSEGEHSLQSGDRLLAFTDGVTEAENIGAEQFGNERLKQAFVKLAKLPATEFCKQVVQWLDRFTEGASEEPFDDITLLEIIVSGRKHE